MTRFKRILIFAVILLFFALYAIAIYYALTNGKNSLEIIVYCFASIGVLSVFIGFFMRYLKYRKDKNQSQ